MKILEKLKYKLHIYPSHRKNEKLCLAHGKVIFLKGDSQLCGCGQEKKRKFDFSIKENRIVFTSVNASTLEEAERILMKNYDKGDFESEMRVTSIISDQIKYL